MGGSQALSRWRASLANCPRGGQALPLSASHCGGLDTRQLGQSGKSLSCFLPTHPNKTRGGRLFARLTTSNRGKNRKKAITMIFASDTSMYCSELLLELFIHSHFWSHASLYSGLTASIIVDNNRMKIGGYLFFSLRGRTMIRRIDSGSESFVNTRTPGQR